MSKSPNIKITYDFDNKEKLIDFVSIHINDLYDKYENNKLMLDKLGSLINNLGKQLINYEQEIIVRSERKENLSQEEEKFYNKFFDENNYFYNSYNNDFFIYKNNKFQLIKEDDIYVQVVSQINYEEKVLVPWKYKVKTSAIKQVKERSIFDAIPESDTIQNIHSLLIPSFFNYKSESKLLLTIIGDNILKKEYNYNFFVHKSAKQLIDFLNSKINFYFKNVNTVSNIKYKFQDHNLETSKLLFIKNLNNELDEQHLKWHFEDNILDLLIVAIHYSNRYTNAINFINEECNQESLKDYCNFLNKSADTLFLNQFIKQFLWDNKVSITFNNECSINFTNMKCLWNTYLYEKNLINFLSADVLKEKLMDIFVNQIKLKENNIEFQNEFQNTLINKNVFLGIVSEKMPSISNFLEYWENNFYLSSPKDTSKVKGQGINQMNQYFEIEEIVNLFKKYCKKNKLVYNIDIGTIAYFLKQNKTFLPSKNIEYINLSTIISKLYKNANVNVNMQPSKYKKEYINVLCKEWDKQEEVKNFLNYFYIKKTTNYLSISKSYEEYSKYKTNLTGGNKFLMNKNCFTILLLKIVDTNDLYIIDENILYYKGDFPEEIKN